MTLAGGDRLLVAGAWVGTIAAAACSDDKATSIAPPRRPPALAPDVLAPPTSAEWPLAIEAIGEAAQSRGEFARRGWLLAGEVAAKRTLGPLSEAELSGLVDKVKAASLRDGGAPSLFEVERYVDGVEKLLHHNPNKIRGGVTYSDHEHPEVVAVLTEADDGTLAMLCSAVAVGPRRFVTAAHCHRDGQGAARMWVATGADALKSHRLRVDGWTYVGDDALDVAVGSVNGTLKRTAGCAGRKQIDKHRQDTVVVAGYGATSSTGKSGAGFRRGVELALGSVGCREAGFSEAYGCRRDTEMLAGIDNIDLDSCKGDSGGPLFIEWWGRYRLAGITSRGIRNASQVCGDGGIYVRVDATDELRGLICDG